MSSYNTINSQNPSPEHRPSADRPVCLILRQGADPQVLPVSTGGTHMAQPPEKIEWSSGRQPHLLRFWGVKRVGPLRAMTG